MPYLIRHIIILIATGFLGLMNGNSQGLILDKKAYQEVPLAKISLEKGEFLPETVSLVEYTPFPKPQGRITSCVGWSIANALTTYRAYLSGNCHRGIIDDNRYSAAFIYNLINKDFSCARGASIVEGLDLIRIKGVCLDASFSSFQSCDILPQEIHFQEAMSHLLKTTYRRIFKKKQDKIKHTRIQIAKGNPVIVGFSVVPKQRLKDHIWYPDGQSNGMYGHAMVVVGYEEGFFNLMNSYGGSWGNKGFIKISEADYVKYAQEAYVLTYKNLGKGDEEKPDISKNKYTISSSITVASGNYNEVDVLDLQPIPLVYDELANFYKMRATQKLQGEFLQLSVALPKGLNCYLINVDNDNYVSSMWKIAALAKDTLIDIPSDGRTYRLQEKGSEQLGLLFSYKKLENYEMRLDKLALQLKNGASLLTALSNNFGKELIVTDKINYSLAHIEFDASITQEDGYIVPVILAFDIE